MNYSNDCKGKWRLRSKWLAVLITILAPLSFSCDDDDSVGEILAPSGLRYASVTEVYEGKGMESAKPVVLSDTQPIFEIAGGTAEDNGVYVENTFTIKDSTGVVSLVNENILVAGLYKLDIKVKNNSGENVFPAAFELRIMPSLAEDLIFTPSIQTISKDFAGSKTTGPDFKGSKPATYALVDNSQFAIDENSGEISLQDGVDVAEGNYSLSVKVTNAAGEQTFEDAITVKLVNKSFSFTNPTASVTEGKEFVSETPSAFGNGTLSFALVDDFGAFKINAETGVISLDAGNPLTKGDYSLSVVMTSDAGDVTYDDVLTVTVEAPSLQMVFEDGWQELGYVNGEHQLGNFTQFDLKNAGYQDSKLRWVNSWGLNTTLRNIDGEKAPTAEMKGKKEAGVNTENDDWLVSGNIDLTDVSDPGILIHIFQLYVWDIANSVAKRSDKVTIKVSEDFEGDVTTANWNTLYEFTPEEIYQEAYKSYAQRIPRVFDYNTKNELSLKTYEGKVITIAIHVVAEDQSTGDIGVQKFQVFGLK